MKRQRSSDTEFSDDELCGCGSGEWYSTCCKGPSLHYVRNSRGVVHKVISMGPEGVATLKEARLAFKEAFGRMPANKDRVLLAGYRYSTQDYHENLIKIGKHAGLPKELIWATHRCDGLMLTEQNMHLATPADREEWSDAIDEYLLAEEEGIDLLEPIGPIADALEAVGHRIEDTVVHAGSYADRAPSAVRKHLPLFFQVLLVSRCHQAIKSFADGWQRGMGNEAFDPLRTIFECSLLMGRLEIEPG